MSDWASEALTRVLADEPLALVTLLAVEGSTPREAATKMLVWSGGQSGTIGGGALEHQAIDQARRMLARGDAAWAIQDYPLGPLLAQCCGGRVRLLIERLDARDTDWLSGVVRLARAEQPHLIRTRIEASVLARTVAPCPEHPAEAPRLTVNGQPARARAARPGPGDEIVEQSAPLAPRLALFGAGHVGLALARVLAPLPFRVAWFDSRSEVAPHAAVTILPPAELVAIAGAPRPFTLVLTHDHALDYALVSAVLAGEGRGYLGMIGSRTKRARFLSRLRADGFAEAALTRLHCPIGVAGLTSKAPAVIAVSVAADLLLRQEAPAAAAPAPAAPGREPALAGL